MEEKIYAELMEAVGFLPKDSVVKVSKEFARILSRYDISEKCTDIVAYEEMPGCVKTYLVTRKIEGLSMKTLELYKLRLTQFFSRVKKPMELITANDIRLYLYAHQEQSGCSDRTLDSIRTALSTFFGWANAEGYIKANPMAVVRPIKYVAAERGHLTEMELEMLRNATKNLRDRAMVEFFYSTGCRVSEIIGVKKTDIDLQKGEVTLFGKGSKYRTSYINARAGIAITDYLKSRGDDCEYLFVTERTPTRPLKKEAVEKMIRELGEKAGLERRVFPHLIRHTTATLGLQRGMDVTEIQKMLGHSRIDTTLIYAKVADQAVKESHKKCIV